MCPRRPCASGEERELCTNPSDLCMLGETCQSRQSFSYHPVQPLRSSANVSGAMEPFWRIVPQRKRFCLPRNSCASFLKAHTFWLASGFTVLVIVNLLQDYKNNKSYTSLNTQHSFTQQIIKDYNVRHFKCMISFNTCDHFLKQALPSPFFCWAQPRWEPCSGWPSFWDTEPGCWSWTDRFQTWFSPRWPTQFLKVMYSLTLLSPKAVGTEICTHCDKLCPICDFGIVIV